jgi:predicted transcriptional regulator
MTAVDWQTLILLTQRRSGLSRDALAKRAGANWAHIGHLARGETADPRFSTGVRLLDVAADYLTPEDWERVRAGSALGAGSDPRA